jgi:O-antigen ligase
LLTSFLLVLPWMAPWASAPLPNVLPLLISWGCIGLLMASGLRLQALDIARAWAMAAVLSSAIGLMQYFGLAEAFSGWVHVPDVLGEARANLRQRNQLATLTSMGILAVLWWARSGLVLTHALWMLALIAIGNAATNSRTGLLQMILVTALVMGWSLQRRQHQAHLSWRLVLWALGVYAAAIWALPHLLSNSSGTDAISALTRMGNDDGCGSRKVLWRNVIELIAQKPWWGWGWNELKYAHYSANYSGERFCEILGNAHNAPLQLAFALGVPIASLVTLSLIVITLAMHPWHARDAQHQLAWGVLAVISLHSLLEFPLWYGPFQLAILLCAVLLTQPKLAYTHATQRILPIMGAAILASTAFIAVDYSRVRQIFIPANARSTLWGSDALSVAKSSVLFHTTADFAEFSLTPVTPENAIHLLAKGQSMLHYSPEPKVIRKVIEAAQMVGDVKTAQQHQRLMKIAFPSEFIQPHAN